MDTLLQLSQFAQVTSTSQNPTIRGKQYRQRTMYDDYTDDELISRFRFGRESIDYLNEKLSLFLPSFSLRNHSLSNHQRILMGLRILASGSFLEVIGDHFGVNKSTVSRIFEEFLDAVIEIRDQLIDTSLLSEETSLQWFEQNNLPRACGCIDGTQVRILAPNHHEEEFVNRKGFHSINVQLVTNGKLLIVDCVAKWPGSTHDSRILSESQIHNLFETNTFGNLFLLGDQGYPLKTWLMTPVRERTGGILNQKERVFNRAHKTARPLLRELSVFLNEDGHV